MTILRRFIADTLIGGVLFLIPLVFLVAVIGKAFQVMKVIATPLGNLIPIDSLGGLAMVEILTVLVMILCCLVAGMLARSPWGKKLNQKLDTVLLQMIPGYSWVKGMTGDVRDEEAESVMKAVLVRFDDQFQVGFEVDRDENGLAAIFLPGAPDPRSGTVSYVTVDRVQAIDIGFGSVMKICKNLGRGSTSVLPIKSGST